MNKIYFKRISQVFNVQEWQIIAVNDLFEKQATIPFVSRYRKEATGNLDEEQLSDLKKSIDYYKELDKRKEYVLKVIEGLGKLTSELKANIIGAVELEVLEDLFLPYKPSRKTRAAKAREAGLDSLALKVLDQKGEVSDFEFSNLICEDYPSTDDVRQGVVDIIADIIATDASVRAFMRTTYYKKGSLRSKLKTGVTEVGKFENYTDYSEPLNKIKTHRALAVFRGADQGVLKIGVQIDEDDILRYLKKKFLRGYGSSQVIVINAIEESFKRLLHPSIENETLKKLKEESDKVSIELFANNLRQLLMVAPLGEKRILAIDPGFRTGCKVVCLDESGALLHNETIFPHPPQNDIKKSMNKIQSLTDAYNPDAIAIGNGTASKETEKFIRKIRFNKDIQVFMVNEDGASVYSASKIARQEFPDYDVTVRGAVSIGRRLMDPLAELIKIDPKSIGVGQYQHDVDQKMLKEELDSTVFNCVNEVGVNLNTASKHLLSYVSGLSPVLAENIVKFRSENSKFRNRNQLKEISRLGPKAFEQAAGFLRISGGDNVLDNTAVHPESYKLVADIARIKGCNKKELLDSNVLLNKEEIQQLLDKGYGEYTIKDILKELKQPGRDPRGESKVFTFNQQIETIADLKEGMKVPGVVTNITDFGAFVDIGIKNNGLVHISEICDEYISHPSEKLQINDQLILSVKVIDIERGRIQLSIKDAKI
jgi:uncharacterized protein